MKTLATTMSWLCLSGTAALAQTTLISIPGSLPDEGFGSAVASPGDVDGDGVPDVAVGVPDGDWAGSPQGVVRLHSGATGALLWEVGPAAATLDFGTTLVAMGDVDGDGVDELLTRHAMPSVVLLSGRTGDTLVAISGHPFGALGSCFGGLSDVDGDGAADFVVGDWFQQQALWLRSGASGAILHKWGGGLGRAAAGTLDLDGDGLDDVVATTFDIDQVLPSKVIAFSTGSKAPLFEVLEPQDAVFWGWALAADADLDGDGLPEIAVSDPLHGGDAGRVTVLRGSDQGVHFEVRGAPGMRLGTSLQYAGDMDGDGVSELVCASGAQAGATGALRVFSGAIGALVLEVTGPGAEGFANSAAGVGDLDGDGANDVAFGWPGWSDAGGAKGQVQVLAGPCPTPEVYCAAQVNSQGCASQVGWSGSPKGLSGEPFVVGAAQLVPGGVGLVIYSLAGADALPALGGTLCVAAPFVRAPGVALTGAGACGGALAFDFGAWMQSGADPALVPGVTVWAQVWSRDPGAATGSNLSDALRFEP